MIVTIKQILAPAICQTLETRGIKVNKTYSFSALVNSLPCGEAECTQPTLSVENK